MTTENIYICTVRKVDINLRTYSAKYIIFMVCFLPLDLSYH